MLFTLDNSTVKYGEQREGERERWRERFVRKLSTSGFLRFRSFQISSSLLLLLPRSSVSAEADGLPGRIERDQSRLYRGVMLYRV